MDFDAWKRWTDFRRECKHRQEQHDGTADVCFHVDKSQPGHEDKVMDHYCLFEQCKEFEK